MAAASGAKDYYTGETHPDGVNSSYIRKIFRDRCISKLETLLTWENVYKSLGYYIGVQYSASCKPVSNEDYVRFFTAIFEDSDLAQELVEVLTENHSFDLNTTRLDYNFNTFMDFIEERTFKPLFCGQNVGECKGF